MEQTHDVEKYEWFVRWNSKKMEILSANNTESTNCFALIIHIWCLLVCRTTTNFFTFLLHHLRKFLHFCESITNSTILISKWIYNYLLIRIFSELSPSFVWLACVMTIMMCVDLIIFYAKSCTGSNHSSSTYVVYKYVFARTQANDINPMDRLTTVWWICVCVCVLVFLSFDRVEVCVHFYVAKIKRPRSNYWHANSP